MGYEYIDNGRRAALLGDLNRIVVKVGTRLLTGVASRSETDRVQQLIGAISRLRDRGLDVLLVTSGAIGAGMGVLGTRRRPRDVPQLQAHAAIGQSRLMYLYETACAERGFHCAQLLLTAADMQHRERHLNVVSCLDALLSKNVLPVINENDSVSVDEIRVGDNDMLAAMVGTMIRADLTILLTTVDGMYERFPEGALGRRISVVEGLDDDLMAMAGGTDGNPHSVGGMITKLKAADVVMRAGEHLAIVDGRDFEVLSRVIDAEDVGTLFCGRGNGRRMKGHKRFLAFFCEPAGDIVVDEGAARAVCEQGRSLLPGGIVAVRGAFGRGDTVRVVRSSGEELGRGVSYYTHTELERIKGAQSRDVGRILNQDACYEEVIHRNYFVVTQ